MSGAPEAVPFVDLSTAHAEIRKELDDVWREITSADAYVGGRYVAEFEDAFASYCGTAHCVGVGSGTDALELIFLALGLGRGDEVLVPANTFVATVEAVAAVGARPVFVDVDPHTLLVTAEHLEAAITRATAAAVIVHLYGQMPDMDDIVQVTTRAGIALVEDAAQAHGAEWAKRRAGSFGRAAAFSFYPGKNLGAFGDAGAVVTNDADLAHLTRSIANHGRSEGSRHRHDLIGRNSRLDALQAAVLSVKLRRLDDWNDRRRAAADRYRSLLDGSACRPLHVRPDATAVHHLEVVRVPGRERLLARLDAEGLGWGLHYPVPCLRQSSFARFASEPLPVVEASADEIVSLPMFPTITEDQVRRVGEAILAVTKSSRECLSSVMSCR